MSNKSNLTVVQHISNNKLFVLIVSLASLLSSNVTFADFEQASNENIVSIGAGAKFYSAPYLGQNAYSEPYPILNIQLNRFFIKDLTIGYHFYNHKRVSLALAANYGRVFLDVDDINTKNTQMFLGIENRDAAVEVGFVGRFYSRVGLVEGTFFHDVSDTYDGTHSSLKISRPIPDTGNWTLVPSFYVNYYSEKYNSYYYGVSEKDNTEAFKNLPTGVSEDDFKAFRPAFDPGNSGHVGVDLDIKYAFTDHFKLVGNISIEKFSGEVETSKLTEDKELITSVIGLAYEF